MKKIEKDKSVSVFFRSLCDQLTTIYEEREATTIASYIFEDVFGIYNASSQSERFFSDQEAEHFAEILSELLDKRPWQYVVGQADFYGLKFKVNNKVLIPRAETEELVYAIIQKHKNEAVQLLDIGTGSGCIAITLQKQLKNAAATAVDVSTEALKVAKENASLNQVRLKFQQLDILDVATRQKMPQYHIIVSNPPYIQDTETVVMPTHVLAHEPHLALFVTNKDPLQFYKAIADFALTHLYAGGWLYFEINEYFGTEVVQLLKHKGFINCELVPDMSNRDRIVLGQLPANFNRE